MILQLSEYLSHLNKSFSSDDLQLSEYVSFEQSIKVSALMNLQVSIYLFHLNKRFSTLMILHLFEYLFHLNKSFSTDDLTAFWFIPDTSRNNKQ